jgi:hypothetical protein
MEDPASRDLKIVCKSKLAPIVSTTMGAKVYSHLAPAASAVGVGAAYL